MNHDAASVVPSGKVPLTQAPENSAERPALGEVSTTSPAARTSAPMTLAPTTARPLSMPQP